MLLMHSFDAFCDVGFAVVDGSNNTHQRLRALGHVLLHGSQPLFAAIVSQRRNNISNLAVK